MSFTRKTSANVLYITRYSPLKIGTDDVGSIVEPTSSLAWADVILDHFRRVISRFQQNISIYLFYTTERMLRTIIMQNSRLIQACFPIKSMRFESADFASVMIDDVGCSRRHQCPQCVLCKMSSRYGRFQLSIHICYSMCLYFGADMVQHLHYEIRVRSI